MFSWFYVEEEITVSKRQLRLRYLMHKQIRESKIKLRKEDTQKIPDAPLKLVRQDAINPFKISKKVKFKYKKPI